jgi:DNA mismatch repair protein MutL
MAIQLLGNETIGKIAAGEVIERPASVVKELIENAIDAGARRIAVRFAEGGLTLIEISDDGHGIPKAEMPVAILRHATSKLSKFEDLDHLATLGFRGEALPSIGAVSTLTIRSRQEGDASGAQLRVDYGAIGAVEPAATPLGTTVTVRDLFANVPARRKFLKQTSTESSYVTRVVSAYAMAYPGIAFELFVDDRRAFSTDGSGDAIAAATGVLGVEVGNAALRIEDLDESAAVPGVSARGWIGAPTVTRSHRQGIVLFVNGRWIQSRPMTYALEEAYHSLLLVGRHPVAMVEVLVDPGLVDVNVHPTKAEVKFVDERAACRAVQRATHAALARAPRDDLPRIAFQPSVPLPLVKQAPLTTISTIRPPEPARPIESEPMVQRQPSGIPMLRVLGQVSAMYIIAEGPEGLYLIDQHAAHERVMYEKILAQMVAKSVDRQPLLDPLVVDLSPEELAVFERSKEELYQIGFEIELFGEGAVVVRSVPALVTGVDIVERLHLILSELIEGGAGTSWLDSVAISAACHTSIRAGQLLSLPEMRELVSQLERTEHPRACGHGRPTMLHLTQGELERQFRR